MITLHLPLTPETHHLINAETLRLTKPGAILVNCGRGALIDNDAAFEALVAGRLAGVGLDVFDPEPPEHHPLFDHPDVVLTPHLMGLSRQATAATFTAAATGVVDVLDGREPAAVANPDWRPPPPTERCARRREMKELLDRQGRPDQRRHPGSRCRHRPGRRPRGRHPGPRRAQRRTRRAGRRRADRRRCRGQLRAGRRHRRGAGRRRGRSDGRAARADRLAWSTRPG